MDGPEPLAAALEHSRMLTRIAGRLAHVGGWSVEVPSRQLRWSEELFELLETDGPEPPSLEEGLALYREPERLSDALRRCTTSGEPFDLELDVETFQGRWLRARVAGEAQRNDQGDIVRVLGAFQDITPQRRTAAQVTALAERLESTFESMTDALYLLDDAWRFAYVNSRAEQLLDRTRDELIGEVVWEAFPETVGTELDISYHRAVATATTQRLEGWYYPPLDSWFDISAYPSQEGLAVYFRDGGERVHREQRLERLAAEEQAAAERLRELDRLKDTFLAAVSHELRTPLTVVQGMGRTLQRLRGALDTARRAELEDALVDHADRLGKLLDDLLDLDRLSSGAGQSQPQACDAASIVRATVLEQLGDGPEVRQVLAGLPSRLEATVDPVQLERITVNLVDNACKYAPPGPSRIALEPLSPDGLVLEVVDDGPGIPRGLRDRVFQPLYRAEEDHPSPGTGIGLTLVAAFAELHGGSAEVVDSPRGAHLKVILPGRSVA